MILLIGGTSETAPLASGLAEAGYAVLVSTATDAPLAIGDHPRISRRTGRLDEEGMVALGKEKGIRAIVDAAHPYAEVAHEAAHNAAKRLEIPCLVFRRPEALTPESGRRTDAVPADKAVPFFAEGRPASPAGTASIPSIDAPFKIAVHRLASPVKSPAGAEAGRIKPSESPVRFAADHDEAAEMAFAEGRPVFLTTGARNLAPYAEAARRTGVPLAVRILDAPESPAACRAAGIPEDRIIAGRGPFSVQENLAAIRRFNIGVIVTKESGRAGGFDAKLAAAQQANCRLIVLRRPDTPAADPAFDHPAALIAALQDLVPPAVA
jgi:precorrin-6A/cobalt-precorrin-6A reductase